MAVLPRLHGLTDAYGIEQIDVERAVDAAGAGPRARPRAPATSPPSVDAHAWADDDAPSALAIHSGGRAVPAVASVALAPLVEGLSLHEFTRRWPSAALASGRVREVTASRGRPDWGAGKACRVPVLA